MKKFLSLAGKFYSVTAIFFLPLVLLFSAVGNSVSMSKSVFSTMSLLLFFSALMSLDFIICKSLKINVIFKRTIHFILAYLSFFLAFFVVPKKISELYSLVVMTLVFVLAYALIGGIKIAVCGLLTRKEQDENYKKVYDTAE